MIRTLITIIACIICFYIYIRYLEHSSLYYPTRKIEITPGDVFLKYEDVFFSTEDNIKLHGWFIPANDAKVTLVFAHGNGGNISHRLDKMQIFNKLGVNTFIFDYRGYGLSQGRPKETGLYKDIQAAYEYIKKNKNNQKIIIYGESLGGAVAVDLASKNDVDGLIVESTFTSVKDMAKIVYPWLPSALLKTKFDSLSKINRVMAPKLHFHGQFDDIVPFKLGQELFRAGGEPKKFVALKGLHNDGFFMSEPIVTTELKKFLTSIHR